MFVIPARFQNALVNHLEVELFTPRLDILPASQRLLWDELESTPRSLVLYGGTALGHCVWVTGRRALDRSSNIWSSHTTHVVARNLPMTELIACSPVSGPTTPIAPTLWARMS